MAITQFENGFITKAKLNELVDGINANTDKLNEMIDGINANSEDIVEIKTKSDNIVVLTESVTKTVGSGGDFATLNLAINWCKKVIPNGYTVTLQLVAGFVMAEQILLKNMNLGFVTISSIDATVMVTSSAINTFFINSKPI